MFAWKSIVPKSSSASGQSSSARSLRGGTPATVAPQASASVQRAVMYSRVALV